MNFHTEHLPRDLTQRVADELLHISHMFFLGRWAGLWVSKEFAVCKRIASKGLALNASCCRSFGNRSCASFLKTSLFSLERSGKRRFCNKTHKTLARLACVSLLCFEASDGFSGFLGASARLKLSWGPLAGCISSKTSVTSLRSAVKACASLRRLRFA